MTIRLSDPRPAFCSACLNHPDERYVDFDAAFDAGAFVDRETQAYVEGSDDLHLCESCLKRACEELGVKPELHAAQRREIQKLQLERDHWLEKYRALVKAQEAGIPEVAARAKRKVAA